jgi:dimethylglycine oxidase
MHANKGDFVGRATLNDVTADIVSRRLCCLTVDDGRSVVLGHEPVFLQGQPARYLTSATFDHTIGQPIAYLVTSARPMERRSPLGEVTLLSRMLFHGVR